MAIMSLKVVFTFLYLCEALVLCCGEIVDLTHPMDNTSLFWPNGQYSFQLDILDLGQKKDYWYEDVNI